MTERLSYGGVEDRTMPAVAYGLYLLGIANGLTILLGLIVAYAQRGGAGPRMRSHYTFLIRTCWLWLAWAAIAGLCMLFGGPLILAFGLGLPLFGLGLLILGLVHIWFALRAIVGVIYLARDEPYPRPQTWFL